MAAAKRKLRLSWFSVKPLRRRRRDRIGRQQLWPGVGHGKRLKPASHL